MSIEERLAVLETESAARRVLARYFAICDDLGPDTPLSELGMLFTEDALWEGRGRYEDAFGSYSGRAAIVAMIAGYCAPVPHFALTTHFLSSEDIRAAADSARGRWTMLQTSTYHDGRADLRAAELLVVFAREDDIWRIARFETRNLFSRRVDRWSDAAAIPVPSAAGE